MDVWESKLMDDENSKIFFKNYEVFHQSKFEKNKLVGFIKNEKSWHDVKMFKNDIQRKSVNINATCGYALSSLIP